MGQFSQDVHLGPLTILRGHPAACSVIALIYLLGMGLIWLAPRPAANRCRSDAGMSYIFRKLRLLPANRS